jgi:hypothetical protein
MAKNLLMRPMELGVLILKSLKSQLTTSYFLRESIPIGITGGLFMGRMKAEFERLRR